MKIISLLSCIVGTLSAKQIFQAIMDADVAKVKGGHDRLSHLASSFVYFPTLIITQRIK